MATVPNVSDNALILTDWGNTVASEINNQCVKKTGNLAISGLLRYTAAAAGGVAGDDENLTTTGYVQDYAVAANGDTMTGMLTVGDNPITAAGATIDPGGQIVNGVGSTAPSLYLRRAGAGYDPGLNFVRFVTGASTIAGSINIVDASHVAYATTSDYRLKDDLGPIDDPVGRIMALQPKHLAWKDSGTEFDGFIAHEVDPVAPYAVQGDKDAMFPADDPYNPDGINPQQLDAAQLVPLLVAALQDALTRIAALEGTP